MIKDLLIIVRLLINKFENENLNQYKYLDMSVNAIFQDNYNNDDIEQNMCRLVNSLNNVVVTYELFNRQY